MGNGSCLEAIEVVAFDLEIDVVRWASESALILASGLSTNGGGISTSPTFIFDDPALTLALFTNEPTLVLLDPALTLLDLDPDPDLFLPGVCATDTDAMLVLRPVPTLIDDLEYR
jgi:hypothetical protein